MSKDHEAQRGRRNRKQNSKRDTQNQNQNQVQSHSPNQNHSQAQKQDFSVPKIPKRDYDPDPVSGKPIENIFMAMDHRDGKGPINFDTALEQIRNAENLGPNEFVAYVGAGNFAVYCERESNGKKILEQRRKISYEDHHERPAWRKELSPGISRDYRPSPQPLGELYSQEELMNFPRMGTGSGIYLPRNS